MAKVLVVACVRFVCICLRICLFSCIGGHMVSCCGKYSHWVTIHIHLYQLKISSSCCKMDIVWNAHFLLSQMCKLFVLMLNANSHYIFGTARIVCGGGSM